MMVHDDESDLVEVSDGENGPDEANDAAICEACWDLDIEVECVETCPRGKEIFDVVVGVGILVLGEALDHRLENEDGDHLDVGM